MAYCTLADIEKYLDPAQVVSLSDDDLDGDPDPVIIDEMIAAADADIDVYLSARYIVPLFPVPQILVKLSAKLAIYYLFLRRKEALVPDKWDKEYDNVLAMLEAIANGSISLGDAAEVSYVGDAAEIGRTENEGTFTFDKLKGF